MTDPLSFTTNGDAWPYTHLYRREKAGPNRRTAVLQVENVHLGEGGRVYLPWPMGREVTLHLVDYRLNSSRRTHPKLVGRELMPGR